MKIHYRGLFVLISAILSSSVSLADFGEIDLVVKESVQRYFQEEGRSVDLSTLSYSADPVYKGQLITIRSSVRAEQKMIAPYWGWFDCTTQIEVKKSGSYNDLGSECFFDF